MVSEQKLQFIIDHLADQRNRALDALADREAELRVAHIKISELEQKLKEKE